MKYLKELIELFSNLEFWGKAAVIVTVLLLVIIIYGLYDTWKTDKIIDKTAKHLRDKYGS